MPTILCIDDDPSLLRLEQALFSRKGNTVLTATDGVTGIALARQHPIDAVVLDFGMPVLNGEQVAQMLMREHPTLPLIVWTGDLDHIPESLKRFAAALVQKGDSPEALISTVEEIVESRKKYAGPPAESERAARGDLSTKSVITTLRLRIKKLEEKNRELTERLEHAYGVIAEISQGVSRTTSG